MELIYEWISESKEKRFDGKPVLENLNLNFSSEYNVEYDNESKELTIQKVSNRKIENFFSEKGVVTQVNCIVGKNGCGKTTILKHLYNTDCLNNTYNNHYYETIQIFKIDGELIFYSNIDNIIINDKMNLIKKENIFNPKTNYKNKSFVDECITKIFISNDQYSYINRNSMYKAQQKCAFTPYDISILRGYFYKTCSGKDIINKAYPDGFCKYQRFFQEKYTDKSFIDILYVLLLSELNNNKLESIDFIKNFSIQVPANFEKFYLDNKEVERIFNYTYEEILNNLVKKPEISELNSFFEDCKFDLCDDTSKIFDIYRLVRENQFTNINTEIGKSLCRYLKAFIIYCDIQVNNFSTIEEINSLLKLEIEELIEVYHDRFSLDEKYINIINKEVEYFKNAYEKIVEFDKILLNHESSRKNDLLVLNTEEKITHDIISYLKKEIEDKDSFILKNLEFKFDLSAGERSFLNIFSYINAMVYLKSFYQENMEESTNQYVLFLLDEADLYCHPEWQRKMLSNIIKMCEYLFENKKVHIIFSTHSPLFLSDFPKENVIKLYNSDEKTLVDKENNEIFAANLYNLYKDNYFLDEFIGDFALTKIKECIQNIKNENYNEEDIESFIAIIGDPIIKKELQYLFDKYKRGKNDRNLSK